MPLIVACRKCVQEHIKFENVEFINDLVMTSAEKIGLYHMNLNENKGRKLITFQLKISLMSSTSNSDENHQFHDESFQEFSEHFRVSFKS